MRSVLFACGTALGIVTLLFQPPEPGFPMAAAVLLVSVATYMKVGE